jgi:hypothetical protein
MDKFHDDNGDLPGPSHELLLATLCDQVPWLDCLFLKTKHMQAIEVGCQI